MALWPVGPQRLLSLHNRVPLGSYPYNISKFKYYKDVGYKTFTKLLNGIVLPVFDYGSSVWGTACVKTPDLILNKAVDIICVCTSIVLMLYCMGILVG